MSYAISKRNQIGVIGLIISLVTIISVFAYFSFYPNMNTGFIGNSHMSNIHDLTNYPTGSNNPASNLDDSTSSTLVAIWIGLMIVGSYLLFHIHFKVFPKE